MCLSQQPHQWRWHIPHNNNALERGTGVPATFMVEIGVRVFARCVVPSKMTSALSGLSARSLWQNQILSSDIHSASLDSGVLALFGHSYVELCIIGVLMLTETEG